MRLSCGVLFLPRRIAEVGEHARLAEAAGFDLLGFGDSQSLFQEVYVSLALAAFHTSQARLGPAVTNPLTRHPAVTAAAIASVNELSGGRAFLGIGTGDSAVLNLGLRPVTMDGLREYVKTLRSLWSGTPIAYRGTTARLEWVRRPAPIFLAAEGPRMLHLAGEVADGVIVGTGLLPEVIADSLDRIHGGARAAGRDPEAIEVWFLAKACFAESQSAALEEIKMALAASAHHAFRFTLEGKRVPAELVLPIERLKAAYQPHAHESLGPSPNARLVDELGLGEYLAERFAVAGTPAAVAKRIRELAALGAERLLVTAIVKGPGAFLAAWRDQVRPALGPSPSPLPHEGGED